MALTFDSPEFRGRIDKLNGRATNSATTQSRMQLSNTSSDSSVNTNTNNAVRNMSASDQQSYANYNQGLANNPAFQVSVANNNRDFTENSRQFDAGLGFKNNADIRANETQRLGHNNQLEGTKYGVEGQVRATQIGADAQVKTAGIGADASKYGADKGLQGTAIMANASRYNALLGAGASLTSQQYKPLQFGR